MLTDELIANAEKGDLETLITLDGNGFLMAQGESPADFSTRLRNLQKNLADLQTQVQKKDFYTIEGMKFKAKGLIPKKDFANSCKQTEELFGFSIDWVPGFYQNPNFSWLFGGCCYSSAPDFFSFFQIRESFKKKSKWLFYNRDELMAHELCHVARSGMNSKYFEEFFAYTTSPKKFRKVCGSVLYSSLDTYLLLIAAIAMPVAQYLKLSGLVNLPLWPFTGFFALLLLNLVRRYFSLKKTYASAEKNLKPLFEDKTPAVLFRCSDEEIKAFAKSSESLTDKVAGLIKNDLRWQVINARFGGESGPA